MPHSHFANIELTGRYHQARDGSIIGMSIRWHEPPDIQMIEPWIVFAHDVTHSSYSNTEHEFAPEYLGVAGTLREACGLIDARYAEHQGNPRDDLNDLRARLWRMVNYWETDPESARFAQAVSKVLRTAKGG